MSEKKTRYLHYVTNKKIVLERIQSPLIGPEGWSETLGCGLAGVRAEVATLTSILGTTQMRVAIGSLSFCKNTNKPAHNNAIKSHLQCNLTFQGCARPLSQSQSYHEKWVALCFERLYLTVSKIIPLALPNVSR